MSTARIENDGEKEWFREMHETFEGYCASLQVEEVLYHERSKYQDILVFKSTSFKTVLVLDGIIQCTGRDEFAYQEMITHIPLFSHPNPKKVLVVGGGDGGVVREVLKHKGVESVTLCEIDEVVVEVCRKYLPEMARDLSDPRATVHIGDGVKYMQDHRGEFDVIITDAPDPIGPAAGLFEEPYYKNMKAALTPGGIICCQGENLYLDLDFITDLVKAAKSVFSNVGFAFTVMPTYTGGHIGLVVCTDDTNKKLSVPVRQLSDEEQEKMEYYNSAIHSAAFVLPQFAKKALALKPDKDT